MDLFRVETLLLLLSLGGCAAQDVLQHEVYAKLGSNVTFLTDVGASSSFITITWSFNDGEELVPVITVAGPVTERVGEGYEGRVWVNHTTGVLTLGPVSTEDNGEYSVVLVDENLLTMTGETSLRVLVPVSQVKIVPKPVEAVETNSTVTLNCSAMGSFLTFNWTNNTKALVADDKRITITNDERWSTLTIAGVRREDLRGPIVCTATNKLEAERSAPFNMSVHYGPEAVKMVMVPAVVDSFMRKGSNVTMSCSADSSPPAAITWFYNDAVLPGKTGPTLVLNNLGEKQSGKYYCSALNAKTLRTVASPVTTFSVLEAISGAKITGPTQPLTAGNATMVNLTCAAAGGTVSSTVWTKDDRPLAASGRVLLLANNSQVTIKTLLKEDRGDYKCRLTNAVNSETANYKMVVIYGPDSATITGKEAVEVTDAVTLKCSADSHPPAQINWSFNGTKMDVRTAEYPIASAAYKDSGIYACEAVNAQTQRRVTGTFQLTVKEEGALDQGLTGGAIAGIVIGVLAALLLAVGAVIYFRRKQTIESPY